MISISLRIKKVKRLIFVVDVNHYYGLTLEEAVHILV